MYLNSGTQRVACQFEQASGHFGTDVRFAAIFADLCRDFANDENSVVFFEGYGLVAVVSLAVFANEADHWFLAVSGNGDHLEAFDSAVVDDFNGDAFVIAEGERQRDG